ncbi:gag-pol polyprotein, partial [Trifolium pratense]
MAAWHSMVGDKLYKSGFASPMLLCVGEEEAKRIMEEVHEGSCGSHIGSRSLVGKILRADFYLPNLHDDTTMYVRNCDKCQRHADLYHALGEPLKSVLSPWPFFMWGVDIVGPFPIDYKQTRFGLPKYIVSDNDTQFAIEKVIEFCRGKGIQNTFISVEHPQANGQAESANKVILRALKRRLASKGDAWVAHILPILWSYHTTPQSSMGEASFTMVYGSDAMI